MIQASAGQTAAAFTLPPIRGTAEAGGRLADFIWFRTGGPAEWLVRPADVADLADLMAALPVDMAVWAGRGRIEPDRPRRRRARRRPCACPRAFAKIVIEPRDDRVRCGRRRDGDHSSRQRRARRRHRRPRISPRHSRAPSAASVRMNAGAYGRDTSDILIELTLSCCATGGSRPRLGGEARLFSYRHSELPEGAIVVEALFAGSPGDSVAIGAEMDRIAAEREASQPLRSPHRRIDLQESGRPQGVAARRPGRLPRADSAATRRSPRSTATFLLNLGAATSADIEALGRRGARQSEGRRPA
jgi:UDP-N-acetylmuramate dehydrogenase